jgi:hypothetical protein
MQAPRRALRANRTERYGGSLPGDATRSTVPEVIRLRQVALVARDLDAVVDDLGKALDLEVCYRDPGVAQFGLVNALFAVGDTFLEVVAPMQDDTTAGRLLDKRGGDGGYMVILQCDDLSRRRARLPALGVRTVWQADHANICGTHLHPRDVGGAILSLDQAEPPSSWAWAGSSWEDHIRQGVVTGIAGVAIGADDPPGMAARWAKVIDAPLGADGTSVHLNWGVIRFEPATARGEGVDAVELTASDPARVGDVLHAGGVELRLVGAPGD